MSSLKEQVKCLDITVDTLRDRVCALEQKETDNEILDEARRMLAQCRNILNQINAIKGNIGRSEKRIEHVLEQITQQHYRFAQTMEKWADYFSLRRNINFRAERDGTKNQDKMTLSEELNEVAINLRRKVE